MDGDGGLDALQVVDGGDGGQHPGRGAQFKHRPGVAVPVPDQAVVAVFVAAHCAVEHGPLHCRGPDGNGAQHGIAAHAVPHQEDVVAVGAAQVTQGVLALVLDNGDEIEQVDGVANAVGVGAAVGGGSCAGWDG